jgi:hypothetical protein
MPFQLASLVVQVGATTQGLISGISSAGAATSKFHAAQLAAQRSYLAATQRMHAQYAQGNITGAIASQAAAGKASAALSAQAPPGVRGVVGNVAAQVGFQVAIRSLGELTHFLEKGVTDASSLNEMVNKTQVVFGNSATSVVRFSEKMAQAFGSNRAVMLDTVSGLGLIAKGAGLSESAAAGLSVNLARLADDASSFYHVDLSTALYKIQAGLVGQSRPLRAFGVMLDEASVKAEAVRMGLEKHGKELSNSAKIMARASLIQKGLADATGDHIRTAGQYANVTRELDGRFENLGATIGTGLIPFLLRGKQATNAWLKDAQYLADELMKVGKTPVELAKMREDAAKREASSAAARKAAEEEATPAFKRAARAKDAAEKEMEKPAEDAALAEARDEAYKLSKAAKRDKLRERLAETTPGYHPLSEMLKGKTDKETEVWREAYAMRADMDITALDKAKSIAKERIGLALGFKVAITKGIGDTLGATADRFMTGKDPKTSRSAAEAALRLKDSDARKDARWRSSPQLFSGIDSAAQSSQSITQGYLNLSKASHLSAEELREIKKTSEKSSLHLESMAKDLRALLASGLPAVFGR